LGFCPRRATADPHSREVTSKGNASKILQNNAGDDERDFSVREAFGCQFSEGADVLFMTRLPSQVAQDRFETMADEMGSLRLGRCRAFSSGARIERALLASSCVELLQRIKQIMPDS